VGAAIGGIAGGGRGAATGAIVGGSVGTVTGAFSPTAAVIQIGRLFGNEIGTAFIQTFVRVREQVYGGPCREAQMGSR
jgi:MFS transporter, DHA2 family, multidrug resistance protein